jgi:hypothetical protein
VKVEPIFRQQPAGHDTQHRERHHSQDEELARKGHPQCHSDGAGEGAHQCAETPRAMERGHNGTPFDTFGSDALGVHGHFEGSQEDAPQHVYDHEGDEAPGDAEQRTDKAVPDYPDAQYSAAANRGTR